MTEPAQSGPPLQREFLRVLRDAARSALHQNADAAVLRDVLAQCERIAARLVESQGSDAPHGGSANCGRAAGLGESGSMDCESIELESLQDYLRARFARPDLSVLSCTTLQGGRSKRSVRATLAPNDLLPQMIVLRQDKSASAQGTQVCDEFPVMRALHQQGVALAEPLWLDASANRLGAAFLAMRGLPGRTPGDYWSAGEATPATGLALAAALAALHRVPAGRIWPDAPASARVCVQRMIADLKQGWPTGDDGASLAVQRALHTLQARLDQITGPSVAVHGDVHFGNLLVDGARISGITDWEFAHAGHAAEDLAFCRRYIESIMSWTDFLQGYRDAGGVAIAEPQLEFFRIWTSLRNLTLAARIRARLLAGAPADMQSLLIAVDALPRLQSALEATLDELDGCAAPTA